MRDIRPECGSRPHCRYGFKIRFHGREPFPADARNQFGFRNPDYYEVMFLNREVPKFLDCEGTALEEVARREKETSIRPRIAPCVRHKREVLAIKAVENTRTRRIRGNIK